ncbi:MAG: EamA family transporter [Bacteroidaceae bacterium]|nr:EamA family transporter [Bacteroidaceae bacterium]
MVLVYLAVLLRILSNPVSNVFQKQLTDGGGHHPLVVNAVSYELLSVVSMALFGWRVDWLSFPPEFWLWATLAGVCGGIGNGFLVLALRGGDLSVLGPINSYKSIVGLVTGIILLGELPSWAGVLGMTLIVGGSYFVFDTTDEGFSWRMLRNREIRYRIWAMILTAIEAVFLKKVVLLSDTPTSLVTWCCFGMVFAFLSLALMRIPLRSDLRKNSSSDWLRYCLLVLSIGTMTLTTNYAFKYMNVGYALALFQLSTLVSIAFGYKLFHETDIRKKVLGSVIMIVGSAIIILG